MITRRADGAYLGICVRQQAGSEGPRVLEWPVVAEIIFSQLKVLTRPISSFHFSVQWGRKWPLAFTFRFFILFYFIRGFFNLLDIMQCWQYVTGGMPYELGIQEHNEATDFHIKDPWVINIHTLQSSTLFMASSISSFSRSALAVSACVFVPEIIDLVACNHLSLETR